MKIKDWYTNEYKTDEMGQEITENLTFEEVINQEQYIYFLLGVNDSVIRERVFEKLSELTNTNYNIIYNRWLNN